MKKRIMNLTDKEKAIKYVCDKVVGYETNKDNIYLIYLSKDKKIIIYEDLCLEEIAICNVRDKKDNRYLKKTIFEKDIDNKMLLSHLLEFLEDYFDYEYTKTILNDFFNTDLEEYEEYKVMKWSE